MSNNFEFYFSNEENVTSAFLDLRSGVVFGKKKIDCFEKAICENANYSYTYAKYILKNRFIKGEKAISKNTCFSYFYAKDILKGRFILGEEAIHQDKSILDFYSKFMMKNPQIITKNEEYENDVFEN